MLHALPAVVLRTKATTINETYADECMQLNRPKESVRAPVTPHHPLICQSCTHALRSANSDGRHGQSATKIHYYARVDGLSRAIHTISPRAIDPARSRMALRPLSATLKLVHPSNWPAAIAAPAGPPKLPRAARVVPRGFHALCEVIRIVTTDTQNLFVAPFRFDEGSGAKGGPLGDPSSALRSPASPGQNSAPERRDAAGSRISPF